MNLLSAQQKFLLEQSRNVWTDREIAKSLSLPWQEETITDILMRNLKRGYPGKVDVIPFSKPLEGEGGADWLWSFVNTNKALSMTMLVQAKRLDDQENEYPDIYRYVGKREPPKRQIDQLIETAQRHSVPAFYAFYNHLSNPAPLLPVCMSLAPSDPDNIIGFGISMAEAIDVRAKMPDKSFATHAAHSIPFHCLLCAAGGQRGGGSTPGAIVESLRERLRQRILDGRQAARDAAGPWEPDVLGSNQGMHPAVARAMEFQSKLEGKVAETDLDYPGIAGVVILTDLEDSH